MTSTTTVVPLRQPDEIDDPLTTVLRSGARRLLAQAIEAEAEAFLAAMKDTRMLDGRERLVRHGHGPERLVQTGIGPVAVQQVKLRDRGASEGTGGGERIRLALVRNCRSGLGRGNRGAYRAAPLFSGCLMPYKANEARRHKIPRARYKVCNWPEYDRALQQRGSLTVWVTPEALAAWQPPRTGQRGRPRDYSDVAIETGHLLRLAFGRPWRQTEGLLRSLVGLPRPGGRCARPHHVLAAQPWVLAAQPWPRARHGAGAGPGERAGARRDRRDRPEGAWRRRMAGGEARRAWKAGLAQTPPRR